MPPARQLEFLLRSFERAAKMRLLLGIHGTARGGGEPGRGEPRRPCEGGLQRFVEGGALRGEAHRGVSRCGQPDAPGCQPGCAEVTGASEGLKDVY